MDEAMKDHYLAETPKSQLSKQLEMIGTQKPIVVQPYNTY